MKRAIVVATLQLIGAGCASKRPVADGTLTPRPELSAGTDAGAPGPVTITIVNQRATAIYVASQTECAQWPVAVSDPDGKPLRLDGQAISCEAARAGHCPNFGGCQGAGAFLVGPGQRIVKTWDGRAMNQHELEPGEAGPDCPTSCVTWDSMPAGPYTIAAHAWSACAGNCACGTTPDAACDRPAGLAGKPDLAASATLTLPGDRSVEVVFR